MALRLDHVVIAVADLARAIEDYRALGFTVQPGGKHPGRTSHNALVVFADGSYLELIAWTAPNDAERWYGEFARHGEGFMDFALVPDSVAQAVREAAARGVALEGPLDGGRLRPDGVRLAWQTARQSTFDLPFFCGDVTPRDLRVPTGEVRRHANGALGIATLAVAVTDVEASLARYAALAGDAARLAPAVALPGVGVRLATVTLGDSTLALLSPTLPDASPFAAQVQARLASRGEGPCALGLRSAGATPRALDRGATHQAAIELVPGAAA